VSHLRVLPRDAAELQLLTIRETMAILQCSRSTLYRRIRDGEFDVTGDGSLTRITLASIRAYQARHKRGGQGHGTR
jgi:excisionase family DNA binding protein